MNAQDPFADPAPIASKFASADSFRGRVVLIAPTKLEHNVPKSKADPSKVGDRITATVTVVDGRGPVQVFSQRQGTGVMLDGPVHTGVWFNQDRIVGALLDANGQLLPQVIGVIETGLKPGQPAGLGNPWGLERASDEQKDVARKVLAQLYAGQAAATVGGASAPAQTAPVAAPAQTNPFASHPATQAPPF